MSGGRELLVVDDSRTIRAQLRMILKDLVFVTVTEAENGRVALDLLSRQSFDGIVTDLNMPELDGFALIEGARRLERGGAIPIVVITTLGEESAVERAFRLGATAYVTKPIEAPRFLATLRRALNLPEEV